MVRGRKQGNEGTEEPTFDPETAQEQNDDDEHDQEGLEPWLFADAVLHVLYLFRG